MRKSIDHLETALYEWSIVITEKQKEQFVKYYELLISRNKEVNLTSIIQHDEVIDKHFIDSLSIVRAIELKNQKIIDIGTGAGFPGIPIKIVYPNTRITLLDSLQKRVHFLEEVRDELELENIEIIHGRAEDFGKKEEYREQYDISVSRAVANLTVLSEMCIPFVKTGGKFISYKAESADTEVESARKAISLLGGEYSKTVSLVLPMTEYGRKLIVIDKCKKTDIKYPRKAGIPMKRPLV